MSRLLNDKAALDGALRQGAERAAAIAEPVVTEVERIVGFMPR
jgi:tryptophanyl-tRNA synthetase